MECEPIFLPEYQPCVHLNRPRLHTESYNYFPFIIFQLVVCHWIFQCKKMHHQNKKNPLLFGLVWRAHPVFINWLDDFLWRVTHKTRHATTVIRLLFKSKPPREATANTQQHVTNCTLNWAQSRLQLRIDLNWCTQQWTDFQPSNLIGSWRCITISALVEHWDETTRYDSTPGPGGHMQPVGLF